ncbi:hypothetical protein [Natrarchaeobius chitinivorans]|uniref:DUF4129 domain-containing protein n=1 Tax=Natrarchaeobius chitinivorans TaxID=1679083 RepID=A0A3N6P0L8_NATCH|nr:hypothetical protein [Natrarchaeobius chitinivorans]RQG90979.1 hypothetical protein EA473_19540 [Natrarchaeobius chitinivorans]
MNTDAWRWISLAVPLILVFVAVSSGIGVTVAESSPAGVASPAAVVMGSDDADPNGEPDSNGIDPHVDPDEYAEPGDSEALRAWLANRLADRLRASVAELEGGEYDRSKVYVGDGYADHADRYGTLVDETGGYDREFPEDVPPPADAFDRAGADQRTLAESVESYRSVRSAYDRAIVRGDEEQALDLARELDVIAADVATVTDRLSRQFAGIDPVVDADVVETRTRVEAIDEEIQREQSAVRSDQFTTARIQAEADGGTTSPVDPVEITGEVTLENGSETVGGEQITVEINDEPHSVQTRGDGQFSIDYRPAPLEPTADELRVRYVPDPGVDHLGDETTVPVSIESTEPSVAGLEEPDPVAYGETVDVASTVTVGDEPVAGAPITLSLAGTELVSTTTTTDGQIDETVLVPPSVPSGDRELSVLVVGDGHALETTSERVPIAVQESGTQLAIVADRDGDGVLVGGQLATVDGVPVAEQPIALSVDGNRSTTVTTDDDGRFEENVTPADPAGEVTVTATYDGEDGNLASAEERTAVAWQGSGGASSLVYDSRPVFFLVVAAVAVGVILSGTWGLWRYVRRRRHSPATHSVLASRGSTVAVPDPSPTEDDRSESRSETPPIISTGSDRIEIDPGGPASAGRADELLERATERLSDGRTNDAVRAAYAAVRAELRSSPEEGTLTHWEFEDRYSGPQAEELASITESYERAEFGPATLTDEEASGVLVDAHALIKLADENGSDDLEGIVIET